jgi:hypothetical protein
MTRSLTPSIGSWGSDSAGLERLPACEATAHVLVFRDDGSDNIDPNTLWDMFSGIEAAAGDYIMFRLRSPYFGSPNWEAAMCMERADWYTSQYLSFAQSQQTEFSGGWSKWWRNSSGGAAWSGPTTGSYPNRFGQNCFESYDWCVEDGLGAIQDLAVRPRQSSTCEAYYASRGGCGGDWQLTIKIAGDRQTACGF